jgi:hypothetical protein
VLSWGWGEKGQLGDGAFRSRDVPVSPASTARIVSAFPSTYAHTLLLTGVRPSINL